MSSDNLKPSLDAETKRISNRIAGLAAQHFATGKNIYYLSALGVELGDDKLIIQQSLHLTLLEFVQRHTSLRTNTYGVHQNVYGIIPDNVDPNDTLPPPARVRYKRKFWGAFISDGAPAIRYINLETLEYDSIEENVHSSPGQVLPIGPEFQVNWSDPNRLVFAYDSIAKWLRENGLQPSRFADSAPRMRASVLSALIASLNSEQLQRTALPLDVVAALLNKQL